MDRVAIERLIRAAYTTRARGDVQAIKALFTHHPRLELAGSPEASPAAGHAEGGPGFEAMLTSMVDTWEWQEHTVLAILIDGNRAAAHWRARLRHTGKDETVETEAVDLFLIEDGKIASLVEFCDTALAAKLMA